MTSISAVLEDAKLIHISVYTELERADQLARGGFYTEAVLRLGRAIEASLYSISRELDIDLTNRVIVLLDNIRESLRGNEVNILRKGTFDEVKALANVSKRLSEAIGTLANEPNLCLGEDSSHPRPNEQLYRELIQQAEDAEIKRKLGQYQNLLRGIQDTRNRAAHTPLDGELEEFDSEAYENLLEEVEEFMSALLRVYIQEKSRKLWASK